MQKEENLDLIKKLASTKVDTSLFSSSRSLGIAKPKREVLAQALAETRAGINVENNREILYKKEDDDIESDESDVSVGSVSINVLRHDTGAMPKNTFGSGLKRPLDADAGVQSVVKKWPRLKKAKSAIQSGAEIPWEGFDSTEEPPSLTSSTGTQTDFDHDEFYESDIPEESSSSEESTSDDGEDSREDRKERYVHS